MERPPYRVVRQGTKIPCRFVITPDGRPAVQDSADFAIMCGMSEHRKKRDEDEAHCEGGAQGRVAVW